MNYYKLYSGDHAGKTAQLSMIEEGAYNRLLDWQYINERPLPADAVDRYRVTRAMNLAERRITDKVIARFFGADGWQKHVREEIEKERPRIEASRVNGKRSAGRPPMKAAEPAEQNLPGSLSMPYTLEKDKSIPATPAAAAAPDPIFGFGLDLLTARQVSPAAARSFLGLMRKTVGDATAFELLQACEREDISAPIAWLRKAMDSRKAQEKSAKKSGGFVAAADKNYHEGVNADGSF